MMLSSHLKNASVARIGRRIRNRLVCYWSAKVVVLCLLVCVAGFEPKDTITLAFASEVDDDGASVDVQLVSSITSKVTLTEDAKLTKPPMTMNRILIKAGKRGLGGGLPGAIAGVVQVLSLMWVRYVLKCIQVLVPSNFTPNHIFFGLPANLTTLIVGHRWSCLHPQNRY